MPCCTNLLHLLCLECMQPADSPLLRPACSQLYIHNDTAQVAWICLLPSFSCVWGEDRQLHSICCCCFEEWMDSESLFFASRFISQCLYLNICRLRGTRCNHVSFWSNTTVFAVSNVWKLLIHEILLLKQGCVKLLLLAAWHHSTFTWQKSWNNHDCVRCSSSVTAYLMFDIPSWCNRLPTKMRLLVALSIHQQSLTRWASLFPRCCSSCRYLLYLAFIPAIVVMCSIPFVNFVPFTQKSEMATKPQFCTTGRLPSFEQVSYTWKQLVSHHS